MVINIELNNDEAIVLFEFLYRLEEKHEDDYEHVFNDLSEQIIIWNMRCQLQSQLSEPFRQNYAEIVQNAKDKIKKDY